MTAPDRWGYKTVQVDGKPVLRHHYSENDGWSYNNRGPERELIVEVLDRKQAEDAIKKTNWKPEVIAGLLRQLQDGKQQLTYFLGREFKEKQG